MELLCPVPFKNFHKSGLSRTLILSESQGRVRRSNFITTIKCNDRITCALVKLKWFYRKVRGLVLWINWGGESINKLFTGYFIKLCSSWLYYTSKDFNRRMAIILTDTRSLEEIFINLPFNIKTRCNDKWFFKSNQ